MDSSYFVDSSKFVETLENVTLYFLYPLPPEFFGIKTSPITFSPVSNVSNALISFSFLLVPFVGNLPIGWC